MEDIVDCENQELSGGKVKLTKQTVNNYESSV